MGGAAIRLRGFNFVGFALLLSAFVGWPGYAAEDIETVGANLLANPAFEEGVTDAGIPVDWNLYGGVGPKRSITIQDAPDGSGKAVHLNDSNNSLEIGLGQRVPAKESLPYYASVDVAAVKDVSPGGSYIQMRFVPSNEFAQRPLRPGLEGKFAPAQVGMVAPGGTTHVQLYLYTHGKPTPQVILDNVCLVQVKELPKGLRDPGAVAPPEIEALKDLHRTTTLVKKGQAVAIIVTPASGVYDVQAQAIAAAVAKATGQALPIVRDAAAKVDIPLAKNAILLGNRSTNALIEKLYERHYTLLDLRYPGPGGYVLRSLHNPFGNGCNAILVGGSDPAGVAKAAAKLVATVEVMAAPELALGWTMDIELGDGVEIPTDLREFETWEASAGYGSIGYFGWNSISKRMAMYYMTGDEFHAREALRLAFPDDQAKAEISDIDGERIENKDDPLAGPYHYNAHMMILYWDLIEESPVFSDEERLRVTRAFSRQLNHHGIRSAYAGPYASTPGNVGSRHGQWTAISLYCLGRYFAKDYDDPIWPVCEQNGALHFAPLHTHAWVSGENDNLFWQSTAIAPIFTYLCLSGDRVPLENGVLGQLLRGQEILISGRTPDWALNYASIGYLHKAAHITGDGRWLEYRNRTGVDLDCFRLGQSYWPAETFKPAEPTDLVNTWQINPLPAPMWRWRKSGIPQDQSYLYMSYRNATDAMGDYILIDGFNGASRTPYHTFAILELRLDGVTALQGYLNQVLTRVDGLVEQDIALDAALVHYEVMGKTVAATGYIPDLAFASWERSLIQRTGRYALLVDDLTSRTDSENFEVQLLWESGKGQWTPDGTTENRLRLLGMPAQASQDTGWTEHSALDADCASEPSGSQHLARKAGQGCMLLRSKAPGHWIEMSFALDEAVTGEVFVKLLNYADRGDVRISLDGKVCVDSFGHYAPSLTTASAPLGTQSLAAGTHTLRLEVVGHHADATGRIIAVEGLTIKSAQAQEPPVPTVCTSELVDLTATANRATMTWTGPVSDEQHKYFFSVVGVEPSDDGPTFDCARLNEAGNLAMLALPDPALAGIDVHDGDYEAALFVLATDHLYARELRCIGGITATTPVALDWDFASGRIHLIAHDPARLTLPLRNNGAPKLNGSALTMTWEGNHAAFDVAAGEYLITGAYPDNAFAQSNTASLAKQLDAAVLDRVRRIARAAAAVPATPPALATHGEVDYENAIVDLKQIPSEQGALLCAAEGKSIHVLTPAGKEIRTMQTDGPIRMLRWWDEHQLLLAGCTDEKVIAFDGSGERKWTFVSEMHPDVFRAAKTYWFKSAPGHEGIHGLHTGGFLDGKSQAFVGSACTLEIIDETGQLVKRLPQFWGKVATMRIIPWPGDSLALLAARSFNGGHRVGVLNNKTLDPGVRKYNSVPSGHTYVGGWSSMNRSHLFFDDFDGDGKQEVMSEINGTWNRVTVWDPNGTAKYDVSFGPGKRIPAINMRDLDTADLTGDGLPDIVTATSSKMIVALTGKCEKLWATRLKDVPSVMNCIAPQGSDVPWIVAGCENGSVTVLDKMGTPVRSASVNGAPTCILPMAGEKGAALVALATDTGQVKIFKVK